MYVHQTNQMYAETVDFIFRKIYIIISVCRVCSGLSKINDQRISHLLYLKKHPIKAI